MMNKTICIAVILFSLFISNVFSFEMKLNTLYLTAAQTSSVNLELDAYGLNYDTVRLPAEELKLEDGNVALYNAIVIEEATKEMLQNILEQIVEYQKKYKVRIAYLNCEPAIRAGMSSGLKNLEKRSVRLTNEGIELAKKYQLNGADIDFEVPTFLLDGDFPHYDVTIEDQTVIPILKYNITDAYAATIVKRHDIESIHFFFGNSNYSPLSYFSSHIWIPWINYGIINGYRRLNLGIQIDDFFINNPFNFTKGTEYRTTIKDMENLVQWQKDILTRMPNGSQFKIELAMNGMFVLLTSNHKSTITLEYDNPVREYGYVKPLEEEGHHKWPETVDTEWDDAALRKDYLYNYYAQNPKAQDEFYWLTHTFSHENLNYASYHDADMEIALNVKMADDPYLGVYKRDCFSPHSIICPEISGLHNGHVLQAFEKNGVHYAVGDASRRDLDSANPYIPLVTNDTFAHYDGFVIIPRQPTAIFWDCSTAEQILALNEERTGRTETWDYHIHHDIDVNIINFLKMRHDSYMFHEGNLRNDDFEEIEINGVKGKFGLVQQWVELMVVEIRKYFEWPLISRKMDDLGDSYVRRLEKAQCQPEYIMTIDDDLTIKNIKVSATKGECTVPLLAIRNTDFNEKSVDSIEQYGDEPQTAWINISDKSSKTVKFNGKIKWNDDSYTPPVNTKNKGAALSSSSSSITILSTMNVLLMASVLLLSLF